jgi:hypothetical protein
MITHIIYDTVSSLCHQSHFITDEKQQPKKQNKNNMYYKSVSLTTRSMVNPLNTLVLNSDHIELVNWIYPIFPLLMILSIRFCRGIMKREKVITIILWSRSHISIWLRLRIPTFGSSEYITLYYPHRSYTTMSFSISYSTFLAKMGKHTDWAIKDDYWWISLTTDMFYANTYTRNHR